MGGGLSCTKLGPRWASLLSHTFIPVRVTPGVGWLVVAVLLSVSSYC